jgi:hypothetical protein
VDAAATRRANLAKGTAVRSARARAKRALADGTVDPYRLVAGEAPEHEPAIAGMTLLALVSAVPGVDPIDLLTDVGALPLRGYRVATLPRERRHEIAAAVRAAREALTTT